MDLSFFHIVLAMAGGILTILLLTLRFRVHAFFALMAACLVTGLGTGQTVPGILALVSEGFGNILKSLGLIIIFGTTLGLLLEKNGSTRALADFVLGMAGRRRPGLAMSLTGFLVGLPIFCDSGYIVLSGLNAPLSRRTGVPVIYLAPSLATGLYAVHCMVPPHPGATAAAATLGADLGQLIAWGIVVAIPAAMAGYAWTQYAARKWNRGDERTDTITLPPETEKPGLLVATLPVVIPIFLIALRSLLQMEHALPASAANPLLVAGEPVIALLIGVILAWLPSARKQNPAAGILPAAVEKAGTVLMIIGAGGAFGAILAAAKPAEHLAGMPGLKSLGLLFPFLVAMLLKTAQGSSTVAIITASSIVLPMLPLLGLDRGESHVWAVLAMGAGSMAISHVNDAYFWVIVNFSSIEMKRLLRIYSVGTAWMGLAAFLVVWILSRIKS